MNEASGISTISILGCGWLGAPLAYNLLAEGYTVKGSTRHSEKLSVMKDVGIRPYLLTLTPELSRLQPEDFFETDLLIINIPPGTRENGAQFHPHQIQAVADRISSHSVRKVIYISSTSVYPALGKEVQESDATTPEDSPAPAIRNAEKILENIPGLDLTILRCGGLMGYDRIPGKYFAGKKGLETASLPVNYIHRDDVIGVILTILKQGYWNQSLNVVAPQHPGRQEVYLQNAADFGFEAPNFSTDKGEAKEQKIISAKKLQEEIQYKFIYPDPLLFRYKQ